VVGAASSICLGGAIASDRIIDSHGSGNIHSKSFWAESRQLCSSRYLPVAQFSTRGFQRLRSGARVKRHDWLFSDSAVVKLVAMSRPLHGFAAGIDGKFLYPVFDTPAGAAVAAAVFVQEMLPEQEGVPAISIVQVEINERPPDIFDGSD